MRARVPALDGVRGLAILLVVLSHCLAALFAGGKIGVDLFFVLSGYLITSLLLDEWRRQGRISLRAFYGRRVRRLVPALIPLLLVGILGTLLFEHPTRRGDDLVALAAAAAYSNNWWLALSGHESSFEFLWTLSQEEQFYLLWPALLIAGLRWLGLRWIGIGLACLALLEIGWRFWLQTHGASWERIYAGADTHSDGMILGCLLAVVSTRRSVRGAGWVALLSALVFVSVPLWWSRLSLAESLTLTSTVGTLLVGSVLSAPDCLAARVFSNTRLRRVGVISYAIYLWNYPVKVATDAAFGIPLVIVPLQMALSYLIAEMSWRWLESPFLRNAVQPHLRPSHEVGRGSSAALAVAAVDVDPRDR